MGSFNEPKFESVNFIAPALLDHVYTFSTMEEWRAFHARNETDTDSERQQNTVDPMSHVPANTLVGTSLVTVAKNMIFNDDIPMELTTTLAVDGKFDMTPESLFFIEKVKSSSRLRLMADLALGSIGHIAVVCRPDSGERSFFVNKGLSPQIEHFDEVANSRNAPLIVVDGNDWIEGVFEVGQIINQLQFAVSLGSTDAITYHFRQELLQAVYSDRVFSVHGNLGEFSKLFGCRGQNSIIRAASQLSNRHGTYFCVTNGKEGTTLVSPANIYRQSADNVNPKKIINTSGAGDTAMGVLLSGLLSASVDIEQALIVASEAAASVIQTNELT